MQRFTAAQADVVYQLINSEQRYWSPGASERRILGKLLNDGMLITRRKGFPLVGDMLFNRFRAQVQAMRERTAPLKPDDQIILCTIRQEPGYQFTGSEKRIAERLCRAGYLRHASAQGRYLVTYEGYIRYGMDNVSKLPIYKRGISLSS